MSSLIEEAARRGQGDFQAIPIIDLAEGVAGPQQRQQIVSEIRDACLTAGFFYISNHGVESRVAEDTFKQARRFFDTPAGVKDSVDISNSDNFRGYQGILTENNDPANKGELHEAFNMGLDPSLHLTGDPTSQRGFAGQLKHSHNLWPDLQVWDGADAFREACLGYYRAVLKLGQMLFPLFALALNLPETFFDDKTRVPAAIMRLLHYPAMGTEAVDELTPGIGAHTDFECFTILRQEDVPGLQVQNRSGDWLDAPCIPNSFLINIGDQFARWTNDIFVSTRHRALPATTRDRYSIPFFFGCDHDVPLIPPDSCVSDSRPAKYKVVTAGEYVHSRLSEIYSFKVEHASG